MKRLLMGCSVYWTSPMQVGSHHLARAFIRRGWEVGFVSYPLTPWHLPMLGAQDIRQRCKLCHAHGLRQLDGKLWTYVPFALVAPANKPILRSRLVNNIWPKSLIPRLETVLRRQHVETVDLLYIDTPAMAFMLSAVHHRASVYRLADRTRGFAFATPALLDLERSLAQSVDLVAYTARNLREDVDRLTPTQALFLPNGVNHTQFHKPAYPSPPEYTALRGPIAVYAGSLYYRFHFQLVRQLAHAMPELAIVIIGPSAPARQHLAGIPNIHILGPRPHTELPRYLQHADVGLIPFDVARYPDLINAVNPLKLYEYMAAGLPVVATGWDELRSLNTPACLSTDDDDFVEKVQATLAAPPDPNRLSAFAAKHDWSTRIDTLLDHLQINDR